MRKEYGVTLATDGPVLESQLDRIEKKLDRILFLRGIDRQIDLGLVPGCSYEGPGGSYKDRK